MPNQHYVMCITAIAVYNYTDVMTTVVLIQTMLLWSEQMTLHVKASQWGWMGEPGATAGAPLTVLNRLSLQQLSNRPVPNRDQEAH